MANPQVELDTSMGAIRIELDEAKAPKSVANFLAYVDSGHYSGTVFHRVIEDFMVQGGGYDATYEKKPTRAAVQNEGDNGLKNERGTVAMARTNEPDSATAQFFVNVKDNTFLNHKGKTPSGWGYTVFGRVVTGMEVVDAIRVVKTGSVGPFAKDAPLSAVLINSARRV